MRGDEAVCAKLFSYISLAQWVRREHPRRAIRVIADVAPESLGREGRMAPISPGSCASERRPRIDPGKAATILSDRLNCLPERPSSSSNMHA